MFHGATDSWKAQAKISGSFVVTNKPYSVRPDMKEALVGVHRDHRQLVPLSEERSPV